MNKISHQHPPSSPVPFPTLVTVHIRPNTSPPPNPTSNTLWQSHKSSLAQGKLQKWTAEIVLSGHQANFKGLDEFMVFHLTQLAQQLEALSKLAQAKP
ncbi:hypothetical protein Tco_1446592 [Tanacetum coccineum]